MESSDGFRLIKGNNPDSFKDKSNGLLHSKGGSSHNDKRILKTEDLENLRLYESKDILIEETYIKEGSVLEKEEDVLYFESLREQKVKLP